MLSDPRVFNYLIIAMFAAASIRWAWAGGYWQALYWLCGFGLNVAVTFMEVSSK